MVDFIIDVLGDLVFEGTKAGAKKIHKSAKLRKNIAKAAEIIENGGLAAFPTETVYGLGADAFNSRAVERIYAAKGRPSDNPLILHVASIEQFLELVELPPEYALALAKAYWPGPLTLIAKKKYHLPEWAGGHPQKSTATVGVRIPNHPIALALIKAVGRPIAAPSANKSGRPSPTSAAHVAEDFSAEGEIDIVLDGAISDVGLESTVVDVTGDSPIILRPGAITAEMIEQTTGLKPKEAAATDAPRSPGIKYKHYAPIAQMIILKGEPDNIAAYILKECEARAEQKVGAYITARTEDFLPVKPPNMKLIILSDNCETIAQNLFGHLRQFDKSDVSVIFAEAVSDTGIGTAIMDRMLKAAEGNVIYV